MADSKKIEELQNLVNNLELELDKTKRLLGQLNGNYKPARSTNYADKASQVGRLEHNDNGIIIEGVFNGQIMIGPDGKEYSVPANYASKSKLVEGDILKLTIDNSGSFIYKQISPVERRRLMGHLVRNKENNEFVVLANEKVYKVLTASVTYFKGEEGDEVVILVPQDSESAWAAVENVIRAKKTNSNFTTHDELSLDIWCHKK